jgi:hypothetical protein
MVEIALSRLVRGFESRWERHKIRGLRVRDFVCTESVRKVLRSFWNQGRVTVHQHGRAANHHRTQEVQQRLPTIVPQATRVPNSRRGDRAGRPGNVTLLATPASA